MSKDIRIVVLCIVVMLLVTAVVHFLSLPKAAIYTPDQLALEMPLDDGVGEIAVYSIETEVE